MTGPAGKEIGVPAAELLAYMYDKSLDALSPHSPVNPIGLYPHRDRSIWARSNLAPSYHVRLSSSGFKRGPAAPILRKDQLLFYSGYGIGGVGRGRGFGVPGGVQGDLVTPLAAAPMVLAEAGSVDEMRADKKAEAEMAFIAPTEIPTETISPVELRSDFSETAFWYPHLLTDADGSVTFEFKVPDSVTSWNVWVRGRS